ncbi:N-acetylneuraminate synthase family protein [Prochlorococcus sp. MIT 1341]|uniref:N-acetylneuraminate synthase family protein n=1 Tax=Prochlorococcus sp. MIT 1341 TaxID=3096221 RepID=UPI002A75082E|nr:N-acetylneuraminate synthase family protein [Prochlorococcus sp. MIT 1341]
MGAIHIIGAGPAGISLAYYAQISGIKEITIYEMTDKIGGMARSWEHKGFILDTGPHIFHTSDKEIAKDWGSIGDDLLIPGNYTSCNIIKEYPNKLFDYPISFETLRNNLPKSILNQILEEYKSIKEKDKSRSSSSFKEFMEGKVGKTLSKLFFTDYPQKVWGIKTDKMLADWAPQRIELRESSGPFYTKPFVKVGKLGTGCFYHRIVEILRKSEDFKLKMNKKLSKVNYSEDKIRSLVFNKEEKIEISPGDIVVSTIPATTLARFIGQELDLEFRGVRSRYLFFKNNRILPKDFNWVYCSDKSLSFNRITEPTTFSKHLGPEGFAFLCVENTFASKGNIPSSEESFDEILDWLSRQKDFNSTGYISEFSTENIERCVYPIQDTKFRANLAKYNSRVAYFENLHVIGTGGEFHYSDMQIIFRKSKGLINSLLKKITKENIYSVPLITSISKKSNSLVHLSPTKQNESKDSNSEYITLSSLHHISGSRVPLIAEIGINHNGDISLAKAMMEAAKESGADFAKFQYYQKDARVEKNSLTEYLHETADGTEMSLNDIFERARLNENSCLDLIDHGKEINLPVFFTVFDIKSASYIRSIGQKIVKIASMDCNNLKLHKAINSLGFETVIISTGMSDIEEVKRSISRYSKQTEVMLMSCRSSYPARLEDIDLGEISYLREITDCCIGYSDHTEGILTSLLATAAGAAYIERHFTTNKHLPGPDNKMSIGPKETLELSKQLHLVSKSTSKKRKVIHPSEQITFAMQKKSLRFPHNLKVGDLIHTDDLIALAPPEGYSDFHAILPRCALRIKKVVSKNQPVSIDDIEILD